MKTKDWLQSSIMSKRARQGGSQTGCVRPGNMVDPKYTMGALILKKYFKA